MAVKIRGPRFLGEEKVPPLLLRISLRNKKFCGEELTAIVKYLISLEHLRRVDILISDSLMRYNFMALRNLSEDEAIRQCVLEGDRWLQENSDHLLPLNNSDLECTVIKWSELGFSPQDERFSRAYGELWALFKSKKTFRDKVSEDINRFVAAMRERKLIDASLADKLASRSFEYILEEHTVHSFLLGRTPSVHLHSGGILKSEAYLQESSETYEWHNFRKGTFAKLHAYTCRDRENLNRQSDVMIT